jgi:hypothetical protein
MEEDEKEEEEDYDEKEEEEKEEEAQSNKEKNKKGIIFTIRKGRRKLRERNEVIEKEGKREGGKRIKKGREGERERERGRKGGETKKSSSVRKNVYFTLGTVW